MALTDDQITAQNFKEFYGQIRPYLNGNAHAGFTPVGTVISVMGKQAPLNYLVCDGTVYNIKDYPELAAYFAGQFDGANNFFGGDGETTFAVPDLRGEFLRGSGTNSHANQGSGANVGVHQDGTEHRRFVVAKNTSWIGFYNVGKDGAYADAFNKDSQPGGSLKNRTDITGKKVYDESNPALYTSRPTNTSVLYCIATKNIFIDPGHNYSTNEQEVGMTEDGEVLYEKTLKGNLPSVSGQQDLNIGDNIANCRIVEAYYNDANGFNAPNGYAPDKYNFNCCVRADGTKIYYNMGQYVVNRPYRIVLQYTKTTD